MWIQSSNPAHAVEAPDEEDVPDDTDPEEVVRDLQATFRDEVVMDLNDGKPVRFNQNGKAQVSEELGEHLTESYSAFTRAGDSSVTDGGGDSDEEGAEA